MTLDTLEDLYVDHLKDLYNAERQILKALPKMAEKATSPKLKHAFESHLLQTETQVKRLEKVFENMQASPRGKKCKGMEGLLLEGEETMTEEMDPIVRDSAMIGAAQKVEHYEVSAYGTAIAYARLLGDDEGVDLFKQSLSEETQADEILTKIAIGGVNEAAKLR